MTARHAGDPLEDRAAIVTGAGHGLGLAIARRFAASGAKVLLVDRDPIVSTRVGEQDLPPKLSDMTIEGFDRLTSVNLRAPYFLYREFLQLRLEHFRTTQGPSNYQRSLGECARG